MHNHAKNCITINSNHTTTFSITIVVAPLDIDEFNSFLSKLTVFHNTSSIPFVMEYEGLLPNKRCNIMFSFNDCNPIDSLLHSLSEYDEVLWIEPLQEMEIFNRWTRSVCQTGITNQTPLYNNAELTGLNMVLGIADTGLDMTHCQFYDPNYPTPFNTINTNHRKVVTYAYTSSGANPTDTVDLGFEGHGTHVCGTAAGNPMLTQNYGDYQKYRGVAYNSKIAFFDIGFNFNNPVYNTLRVPTNLDTGLFDVLYAAGARVLSMSWGSSLDIYNSKSSDVDKYMFDHPDVLIIFAAGNNGTKTHTVGSPATCKNCLTVGAHLNDAQSFKYYAPSEKMSELDIDSVAGFSSKGPTNDNRIKPDILAPGWYITSALASTTVDAKTGAGRSHCDVTYMRGTSMATPAAAGAAVLVYEYFTSGRYPSGSKTVSDAFTPSGALVKAMLIASGQAMKYVVSSDSSNKYSSVPISTWSSGSYPNSVEGYGRLQLDNVLNFGVSSASPLSLFVKGAASSSSQHYAEVTSTTLSRQYTITAASTNKIRVCLAYTDKEASSSLASGTSALINKLSVTLYAAADLNNPLKNTLIYPDTANNVQMIEFATPSANTQYNIVVQATTLSTTQPFALVIVQDVTPAKPSEEFTTVTFKATSTLSRDNIIGISLIAAIALVLVIVLITIYYQKRVELYEPVSTGMQIPIVELASISPTRVVVPQGANVHTSYSIDVNE